MSHKRKAEDDPVIDSSPDEKDQVASESKELTIPNDEEGSVGGDDDVGINDIEDNSSSQSADSDSDVSIDCSAAQAFVLEWLEDKRESGELPFNILKTLGIDTALFGSETRTEEEEWGITARLLTSPDFAENLFRAFAGIKTHRHKLPQINTFEDAVELIQKATNIVILTGAGVSVSCGIPDFRSPGGMFRGEVTESNSSPGLYDQIEEKYHLPDPQCLFDIHYLRDDPTPFFEFAREIYPGKHTPSATHYFIKNKGKLLRNYTQNIDTLEMVAGIDPDKLVNCHGSFATAGCIMCKTKANADEIREEIMNGGIPRCKLCNSDEAFMKPDIVFFGEQLPDRFGDCFGEDRVKMDLLIVMGSSLKVRPVAMIPELTPTDIPQVLVNRELVAQPHEFDYAYLGDCDNFVKEVCTKLGWTLNNKLPSEYPSLAKKQPESTITATPTSSTVTTVHTTHSTITTVTSVIVKEETSMTNNNGTNGESIEEGNS